MQPHEFQKMFEAEGRYFWFVGKHRLIGELLDEIFRRGVSQGAPALIMAPVILDVGCGTGGLLDDLSEMGFAVGVDRDKNALSFCLCRGIRQIVRMDWENSAIGPETCDAIVASDFIEHLEDDVGALVEMRKALRPTGKLLITAPSMPWLFGPHDVALGHKRRYTRRSLKQSLGMAGLWPERVFSFMSVLAPIMAPMRLIMKFAGAQRAVPLKCASSDTIPYNMPAALNDLFISLLDWERGLVMRGHDFKIGSTLVAIAGKERL